MEAVELVVVDPSSVPARTAVARYVAELDARFPGGFTPGSALDEQPSPLAAPRGAFVLALRAGEVVGCGGVVHLDDERSEVKRMWVAPEARGSGLGRRLLTRLEDEARSAGRRTVVLDTNATLAEAVALYASTGYDEVEPYNDNPFAQHWFAKQL